MWVMNCQFVNHKTESLLSLRIATHAFPQMAQPEIESDVFMEQQPHNTIQRGK